MFHLPQRLSSLPSRAPEELEVLWDTRVPLLEKAFHLAQSLPMRLHLASLVESDNKLSLWNQGSNRTLPSPWSFILHTNTD